MAKIWFDSLQAATQTSLRLLREAFVARFKPQSNIDISMSSLAQKADKSVKEYFSRFIDNLASKELPINIQISIITQGLKPPLISLVMPQNPQTQDLAIRLLRAFYTEKDWPDMDF